jgi:hypothetical protein
MTLVSLHLLLQRRGGVTETFHRRYGRCANRGRIAILPISIYATDFGLSC